MSDYPIVRVRWIDSAGTSGWRAVADAISELDQPGVLDCVTVGFLVGENERAVMLAMGLGHVGENVDMTIQIPRVAITSIVPLAEPAEASEP